MGAYMRSRGIPFRARLRLVIATLFCAASANTGLAQSEGEEIVTDRPSSGVTDISAGFKQQLGLLPGGFDLFLIVATSAPSGTRDKTTHRLGPFLKVPRSREMRNGWSVGGMASIFWPTEEGKRNLTWESTFVLQRDLSRALDVFAGYSGDYPQHGGARQIMHFGTADRINSTNQVDFHFGFGLSPATPQQFFAAGYSFRIDRLWDN
jgi:hypothetical protein